MHIHMSVYGHMWIELKSYQYEFGLDKLLMREEKAKWVTEMISSFLSQSLMPATNIKEENHFQSVSKVVILQLL